MSVRRLLIAERGPMAGHLIRVYETLGVETVAVCGLEDDGVPHLDEASYVTLVPADDPRALIDAANDAGCDGLHPGLGPLAEDADFARQVGAGNLLYVGAPAPLIERLSDRWSTRMAALEARVPVVPGTKLVGSEEGLQLAIAAVAQRSGYPMWIKDAAGRAPERVDDQARAERRGRLRLADGERIWLEADVREARHVVVTVVGDGKGEALGLGPRGRVWRRGGHLSVDQYPATVSADLSSTLNLAAETLAKHVGFQGVGCVGFLIDPSGAARCLGLRPRLQLGTLLIDAHHGVKLPEVQLRLAVGDSIGWTRAHLTGEGFTLGFRVRATQPGQITRWSAPAGVEVQSAVGPGCAAEGLLAVMVVRGPTRQACVVRASAALRAFVIEGVETNIADHLRELGGADFWSDRVQARDPDTDDAPD